MQCSAAGSLIARVSNIEFMLDAGFHIVPDDVTVEEFRALRALAEERDRQRRRAAVINGQVPNQGN